MVIICLLLRRALCASISIHQHGWLIWITILTTVTPNLTNQPINYNLLKHSFGAKCFPFSSLYTVMPFLIRMHIMHGALTCAVQAIITNQLKPHRGMVTIDKRHARNHKPASSTDNHQCHMQCKYLDFLDKDIWSSSVLQKSFILQHVSLKYHIIMLWDEDGYLNWLNEKSAQRGTNTVCWL